MGSRLASTRGVARRSLPAAVLALEQWLRIPSVSGVPAHRGDVRRAAEWAEQRLRRMTRDVRVVTAPDGPVVVAHIVAAGRARSVATLVVYGHLDVKPPGPGWTSRPFVPVRRGNRLIARGASDDKGQLMAHLVALEAWAVSGGPPCDVIVVIDGAEEIGSPGLAAVLDGVRDRVARGRNVVAVLVSDTRAAGAGRPTLTVSQRGMLTARLTVDVGGREVHAGRFGGAVVDPSLVLSGALLRAVSAVTAMAASERTAQEPTDDAMRVASGGRAMIADRPATRATTRAAASVTSLRAGGTPGAIPTRATAELDIRLPPGALPMRARAVVATAVASADATAVHLRWGMSHPGTVLRHSPGIRRALRAACRAGFGVDAVDVSSGGSIPAVALLRSAFGVHPILLGFGPCNDNAHGPNEHLDLHDWGCGVDTSVVFMENLARTFRAKPRPMFAEISRPLSTSGR